MGFALTYFEARGRFLAAAAGSGATVEVHELSGETDPDGRALTLDVARSGPSEADVVLVCLSGTHGAEFFAGSAAQVAWLERARQAELPAGFAMVLIHAVNPFGFAHLTRTNERGVDLNRNAMDFGAPLPANDIYGDLHPVVDAAVADYLRSGRLSSARVEVIERCRDALIAVHGRWAVADSIERGQYRWPDGLEYGGDRLQWSLGVVFDIVRRHVAQARHVAYIDGHTLLRVGDGNVVYLCFNREDNSLRSRCASWWGADRIDRHTIGRQWDRGRRHRSVARRATGSCSGACSTQQPRTPMSPAP